MGKAELLIAFDRQPVSAGSHLTGRILVNVQGEISGSNLVVTLNGTERTKVDYIERVTEGSSTDNAHHETKEVSRTARAFRSILQVTLPTDAVEMIQYGGRINAGRHEVPFDIELPDQLPSSFTGKLGGGHCEIDYKLKAVLKGSGTLWNYNAEETVQILSKPLATSRVPYQGQPVTENIVSCCCFNKGSVSFGVAVTDTKLDKGETCNIGMSVRNYSAFSIQQAKAVLKQTVSWEARDNGAARKQKKETVLGTFNFHDINRDPLDEDEDGQTFKKIHEELQAGKHVGEITMPLTAYATYHGALIKIDHELEVEISLEGGCCINGTLVHDVPIQCGEPQAPGTPPPPPPEAAVMQVGTTDAHLGGNPTGTEEDLLIPPDATGAPSMETLFQEMAMSLKDADVVKSKLDDPEWDGVFDSLAATAFGFLISKVDLDFDQPAVAEMVAQKLADRFTCAHVVAAMKSTPEWNRGSMVEKLVMYCSDLKENQEVIKSQLTDWEKVVTEQAFVKALRESA